MVRVDETKKVGSNIDIGGADSGSSQPYMSPTDKHFASGGSIFTAPGVKKEEPTESAKASGGSLITQALTGAGAANSSAKDAVATSDAAAAGSAVAKAEVPKAQAHVKATTTVINQGTQRALALQQKSEQQGQEIVALTAERDQAQADFDAAPVSDTTEASPPAAPAGTPSAAPTTTPAAGPNPFAAPNDGTGTGDSSAFNISSIGAGAPQAELGTSSGLTIAPKVKAASSGANTTADGAATPPATTPTTAPQASGGTENTENAEKTEAGEKLNTANNEITQKIAAQTETNQQSAGAVAKVKTAYKTQAAGLKAESDAMNAKIQHAQDAAASAQNWNIAGSATTTVGTTTTSAGAALSTNPYTATLGGYMMVVGGGATVAGVGLSTKGKISENSANSEKNDATAAKTEIAAQGKELAKTYSQALGRAMKAEKAQGKTA